MSAPASEKRWMHAYTYSGHATCCAVALGKIWESIAREDLVANAAARGSQLLAGLEDLAAQLVVYWTCVDWA